MLHCSQHSVLIFICQTVVIHAYMKIKISSLTSQPHKYTLAPEMMGLHQSQPCAVENINRTVSLGSLPFLSDMQHKDNVLMFYLINSIAFVNIYHTYFFFLFDASNTFQTTCYGVNIRLGKLWNSLHFLKQVSLKYNTTWARKHFTERSAFWFYLRLTQPKLQLYIYSVYTLATNQVNLEI